MDRIEYVLIARINGKQVFYERYPDTFELQEAGLDAAENTVSAYLDSGDLEPEELSYARKTKHKQLKGEEDE